jgi:antirestriction protein ArdC
MSSNQAISGGQTSNNNGGKIRSIRQMVRAGVERLAHDIEAGYPEALADCLKAMARFHTYSFGNVLLIATQRPKASLVAGWRGWNELGRAVRQGEKGILIFAPILSEPKRLEGRTNGNADTTPELLGFRPVRVFDVEQTEGETVRGIGHPINADLADTLKRLMEFAAAQEIRIEYSDNIAPAKATSYRGVIRLRRDTEAAETVLVLARELAVQMLYTIERRSFVTRDVLMREARAVAFVLAHALGLESENEDNVQLYQGNTNLLAESLEVVQRTAAVILGAVSPSDEPEENRTAKSTQGVQ